MIKQNTITIVSLMRVGGGFVAVFCLVMSLFILFAIPVGCSFVGSLQLIILAFLFIIGLVTFLVGSLLLWRRRKQLQG